MFIAEREGFEPPVPDSTTVFKTAGLNRSPISPFAGANVHEKNNFSKFVEYFSGTTYMRKSKISDYQH